MFYAIFFVFLIAPFTRISGLGGDIAFTIQMLTLVAMLIRAAKNQADWGPYDWEARNEEFRN